MRLELSREELSLLRHCVEFNSTGKHGSEWAKQCDKMEAKLLRALTTEKEVA